MKKIQHLVGVALLALGLNASANDTVINTNIPQLNILKVAPCKASGDGSYTEMVTTMASVLPPAEADALLARYCEECQRMKFNLSKISK